MAGKQVASSIDLLQCLIDQPIMGRLQALFRLVAARVISRIRCIPGGCHLALATTGCWYPSQPMILSDVRSRCNVRVDNGGFTSLVDRTRRLSEPLPANRIPPDSHSGKQLTDATGNLTLERIKFSLQLFDTLRG